MIPLHWMVPEPEAPRCRERGPNPASRAESNRKGPTRSECARQLPSTSRMAAPAGCDSIDAPVLARSPHGTEVDGLLVRDAGELGSFLGGKRELLRALSPDATPILLTPCIFPINGFDPFGHGNSCQGSGDAARCRSLHACTPK